MVGGGSPTAEHSSSSGLFTAMVSSSGELELEIFGGSGLEKQSVLAQEVCTITFTCIT